MSLAREMIAAGPGCAFANGLLNCFETTKVKVQLHDGRNPVYHKPTMSGIMKQVAREEGFVRGLMTPGLSASLTRSVLYGAYRVGLYPTVRNYVSGADTDPTLSHRIISGMFTGGLGSMISCPLDVLRTRMQADSGLVVARNSTKSKSVTYYYTTGLRKGETVRYRNLIDAFSTILRTEGLRRGLYRGASVTVARASLLNGSQLASYDTMKRYLQWEEGPMFHALCALASGIIAQTVIMPIDTVKSHMMLGNSLKDVGETVRRSGPAWFYRGYLPACAGQGIIMVLQMPLIEEFRRLLGISSI